MAFYDWNHDGKKDFTDDFIEYQIYKDCTSGNSSNSGSSSTWWVWLLLAIVVGVCPPLGAILFIGILLFS
ncbi:MAG: hypothetical protein ACI4ES_00585 [Roseburia sp.]